MKFYSFLILTGICLTSVFANAQTESKTYNPQDYYLPEFTNQSPSPYRSSNGSPAPFYWQNKADYLIHATLNERDTTVTGDVTITYTNNSPDKLDYLWLQIDQNLFDPKSRGAAATPVNDGRFNGQFAKGGYKIGDVVITYHGTNYSLKPIISDTRMQLRLKTPLLAKSDAKGDKISIKINYSFVMPAYGADRMGRMNTNKGMIYEVAEWYPRMCVYDDVEGWNTLPYMGLGEFYCDYGDYDYYITAPRDLIVYGAGDLQNPAQVLAPQQIQRLAQAANSDRTVAIISADEIGKISRPGSDYNLVWHFTMKNTRDVAWAASKALIWDAARVNLPSGRKTIAMSAYPPISMGDSAWSRATEYLKGSMEIYSEHFFEYPWNSAVNIGGLVGGMEYPGIIFCDYREKRSLLWDLIAHEIGHDWFPMIVGSNERKYMWQDEGFNTYINDVAKDYFNKGEYAKDTTLVNFLGLDVAALPARKYAMMTPPEAIGLDEFGQYYNKTSAALKLLRDVVIGKERFDYAFRKYTEAWAFKHPTPYDFFHFINNAAGEDLSWFWKEWFFTTWTLDQAVIDVKYVDGDPSRGSLITIENKGKMIMPVIIKVTEANGTTGTIQLPVDVWQRGGVWTFKYASKGKLSSVVLDPQGILPDVSRGNNEWSN